MHETVPAVNLNGIVGCFHGQFSDEELGHRRLHRVNPLALVFQPGHPVDEQAHGFDDHFHIRQLVLDGLEGGNGPVKLPAFLGVRHASFQGILQPSERGSQEG